MNERDWEILRTIAEEQSISRAAERLYLSQPALSYRLGAIEAEFKTQVFLRTHRGVVLTRQGEQLVAYARAMLVALARTRERIASGGDDGAAPVRIGASELFAHQALPPVLSSFRKLHPAVSVHLRTGASHAVVKLFDEDELELAIVRGDFPWAKVKHLLREEPMYLVSRRPLDLERLPDTPRISCRSDDPLELLVEKWWGERFPFPPTTTMVVDTVETCRQMVAHDLGYAILPAIGVEDQEDCRPLHKAALHWSDGTPALRRTWLLCRDVALAQPAVRGFVDHLLSALPPCEGPRAHGARRRRRRAAPRAGYPAAERSSR